MGGGNCLENSLRVIPRVGSTPTLTALLFTRLVSHADCKSVALGRARFDPWEQHRAPMGKSGVPVSLSRRRSPVQIRLGALFIPHSSNGQDPGFWFRKSRFES